MNLIHKNKSLAVHIGLFLFPPIVLIAVVYFVCLYGIENQYSIEIVLAAEKEDTLSFYWPGSSGHYSEERSAKVKFPAGFSSHEVFLALPNSKAMLRIDPGVEKNRIIIHQLTFSRFGSKKVMVGQEIGANIRNIDGLLYEITDEGVAIDFQAGDAKFFLAAYPKPLPSLTTLISFSLALLLASVTLIVLTQRLLRKKEKIFSINIVVGAIALVVLGWSFNCSLYLMFPICFFFSYAILYVVVSGFRVKKDKQLLLCVKPLLIVTSFLGVMLFPLFLTVSPNTKYFKATLSDIGTILTSDKVQKGGNRIKMAISKLEGSFKSYFPFRKELINLNASIKIFGLGFSPSAKAIYGKDGMFFEGYGERRVESDIVGSFDNITDYMGLIPFKESELEEWLVCLEERYYWLKERGVDYVFVLAPTKALVYPEKLPSRILRMKEKVNKPTRYEQLVTYLEDNSVVPVVDLRTSLIDAKDKSRMSGEPDLLLYYRTDFHWNYYGSFLAYQAIVDEINSAYPKYGFDVAQIDEFSIHKKTNWVHFNFINALGLDPLEHQNETYLTFFPKEGSTYNDIGDFSEKGISDYSLPKRLTDIYKRQKTGIRLLENKNGKTDLIFVIGDSFSEKYFGYFSGHAKKTLNFRTVYSFSPDLFTEFSPDLVIQEVLNMYLLQKPPGNKPKIKQARVAALHMLSVLAH